MTSIVFPESYADLMMDDDSLELIYGWMHLWELYLFKGMGGQRLTQGPTTFSKGQRYWSDHLRTLQNGLPYRRCLLIYGPTGVGKTVLAKYVSRAFGYDPLLVDCIDEEDPNLYDSVFGTQSSSSNSLLMQVTRKESLTPRHILILDNIDCFSTQQYQNNLFRRLVSYDRKIRTGQLSKFIRRQHPIILIATDAYARNVRQFRELSAVVHLAMPAADKVAAAFQKRFKIQTGMSMRSFITTALTAVSGDIRTLAMALEQVYLHKCTSLDLAIQELLKGSSSSYIDLARAVATQNYKYLISAHHTRHDDSSDQILTKFLHSNNLNPLDRSVRSTAIMIAMLSFLNYGEDELEKAVHRLEDHAAEIGLLQKFDIDNHVSNHVYINFLTAISSIYQQSVANTTKRLVLAALVQLNTDLLYSPLPLRTHDSVYTSLLYPSAIHLGTVSQRNNLPLDMYYTTASPLCLANIGARSFLFASEVLPLSVAMVSLGAPDIGNILIMPPTARLSSITLASIIYDVGLSINLTQDPDNPQGRMSHTTSSTLNSQRASTPFGTDSFGHNFTTSSTQIWDTVYRSISTNSLQILESMRDRLLSSPTQWRTYADIDSSVLSLYERVESELEAMNKREAGILDKELVYIYSDGATTAVRRPITYSMLCGSISNIASGGL
ncbi:Hypothetical protein GLP15_4307 [Giardia lamblia P15]|uniref:AAA+ ATPase domain-containing protein n=1 Tax=Giardia intestinalis (strain P15) TaxID=658858 RepID=E1EWW2_GIAIA|nr:Hypothetical protein GLP15_4307 [Giardia lamblia P15]